MGAWEKMRSPWMSYMHGRQKQLYGAPEGGGGCQLRSTSKKQAGNGVKRAGQLWTALCALGNGVSRWEGVDGKDGGCQGPASSRFLFVGNQREHIKWLLLFLRMTLIEDDPSEIHCRK